MQYIKPHKKFKDSRGLFLGIVNINSWKEINYIETEANKVRGGHYHKIIKELFFIIEGEIDVKIDDIYGNKIKIFKVKKGSIFIIEPFEVHTFMTKKKSKWINVLSKKITDNFYDIYKL